jgi:uncharacterized tellurite resistance protein B-like protein
MQTHSTKKPISSPDFLLGIVALYYLLIHADGSIHEKEIQTGRLMIDYEGIDRTLFDHYLEQFGELDRDIVLKKGLSALQKCNSEEQIRIMAWLTRLTNCDGYMDQNEWALLYNIYFKHLNLNLKDILEMQKALPSDFI